MSAEATYRFGPGGPTKLILGLTGAQVAILSAGGAVALLGVLGHFLLLALAAPVAAGAWALVPLGGRRLHAWSDPLAGLALAPRRFSPEPTARRLYQPERRAQGLGLPDGRRVAFEGDALGIARLGTAASFTVAMEGPALALAGDEAHAGAGANWAGVLTACARSPLRRLQLTEMSTAESGLAQRAWLDSITAGADSAALESYRAHIESLLPRARRHQLYLTAACPARNAGPEAIAGHAGWLISVLSDAGFAARALRPDELAELAGRLLDPLAGVPGGQLAWRRGWDQVQVDGASHAVFEAVELPRVPVGPAWISPLVSDSASARSRILSLHLELTPPEEAVHRAERAAMTAEGESDIRARFGFRSGARVIGAAQAAAQREAELAGGVPDTHFVLLAGVSVTGAGELDAACAELEGAAARTGVVLRRCYGRQPEALVGLAPVVGLGIRGLGR